MSHDTATQPMVPPHPGLDAPSVADDLRYCRELTHARGANFSVGFRFLPQRKRQAVYAAYSFCRWADDLADEAGIDDPLEALDEWERELQATYRGQPTHPVSRALAAALQDFPIPQRAFAALIAGCRRDQRQTRYADFEELLAYCEEVAVSISDISLAIFGVERELAPQHGRDLAIALQLTNVLRDVGEDLGRDRIYLPQDELARFGVSEGELRRGLSGRGVRELLAFQAARASGYFRRARPLVASVSADARVPVALMGSVYASVLAEIERRGYAVFAERVSLSLAQKLQVVAATLWRPEIRAF
jgi:phytoene synthase